MLADITIPTFGGSVRYGQTTLPAAPSPGPVNKAPLMSGAFGSGLALTIRSSSTGQRRFALLACAAMVMLTMVLLPFAHVTWAKIGVFLPIYQTLIIGAYAITAYLMYGHYRATKATALLHLSAGYLFTCLQRAFRSCSSCRCPAPSSRTSDFLVAPKRRVGYGFFGTSDLR